MCSLPYNQLIKYFLLEAARVIYSPEGGKWYFLMATLKIYTEDLQIAQALIKHNESITRNFFYRQCYALFKSIYDNYYTDCTDVKEFIDEIYLVVLAPSKITGRCQMENYKGKSQLKSWLKSVCLYYCYKKYKLRKRMPVYEPLTNDKEDNDGGCDRLNGIYGSVEIDFNKLNYQDALVVLGLMPNKRYSSLVKLRYLEQKTDKETAEALGMTMDNYYNKKILAKKQYEQVYRKETQHGK